MNECRPSLLEKITDTGLRDFALHQRTGTETVLIECELPEPEVELQRRHGPGSSFRAVSVHGIDAKEAPIFQQLGEALAELLEKPPVPLPAAHAYAAVVTAEELIEACRLQEVWRISRSHSKKP